MKSFVIYLVMHPWAFAIYWSLVCIFIVAGGLYFLRPPRSRREHSLDAETEKLEALRKVCESDATRQGAAR